MITSNRLRFTGIATGIDTDMAIQQMMKVEYTRVDKMKQAVQLLQWKQEGFRDIANLLRGLQDTYFNNLKMKDNFRSPTAFSAFTSNVKSGGVSSEGITVEAGAGAAVGSHTLIVKQVAEEAVWKGTDSVSGGMKGRQISAENLKTLTKGKEFNVTYDGVTKKIRLDGGSGENGSYTNITQLQEELQQKFDIAFGITNNGETTKSNIEVLVNGAGLEFKSKGHELLITNVSNTYVSSLGFSNGQTNAITGKEINITEEITGKIKVSLNGEEAKEIDVHFTKDNIAESLEQQINSAFGEGNIVKVTIGENNKLQIISYDTSNEIKFSTGDTDNVLDKLGLSNGATIKRMEGSVNINVDDTGKEFSINVDGMDYLIELTKDYKEEDLEVLAQDITSQLSETGVQVIVDGNKLKFTNTNGNQIKVSNNTPSVVENLGFKNGAKNTLNLDEKIENAFGIEGNVKFELNGKTFEFGNDITVKQMMDEINGSAIGVSIRYSTFIDSFTIQGTKTGSMNNIQFNMDYADTNTNTLFRKMNLITGESSESGYEKIGYSEAKDAIFNIDGVDANRTENTFNIDGIKYTINLDPKKVDPSQTFDIKIGTDPDQLVEKIIGFVDKYNEIVDTINGKYSEKRARSGKYEYYEPLTEEQRKEMSEADIKLWEEKAKQGVLRGEDILSNIASSMRRVLYEKVEGLDIGLYDIGITTSNIWQENGKLVINEEKLKKAIQDMPDKITQLFTKESTVEYTDTKNRNQRMKEQGLAHRLYDILQDNIRTSSISGSKGLLIEKAGQIGTTTEYDNTVYNQIKAQNEKIDELLDRLMQKEERYYAMFARLEAAMQKANAQSQWLTQQLGGMGGM